jgi:hypothetical protein
MVNNRIFFLLIVSILFFPYVYSLGISGGNSVDFQSNSEKNYPLLIVADNDGYVKVYIEDGELKKYITLSEDYFYLKSGEAKHISYTVKLPEKFATPGDKSINIDAEEANQGGGFMSVNVRVRHRYKVRVPYPEKYLLIKDLVLMDVKLNSTEFMGINIINRGNETVENVDGFVDIYKGDKKLQRIKTTGTSGLGSLKSETLNAEWNTSGNPSGRYNAAVIINYDTGAALQNGSFRIGDLYIEISNFSKQVERNKINEIKLDIESMWNDPIPGVYGSVRIFNSSKDWFIKTVSEDLSGWGASQLKGYWDTTNLSIGTYDSEMTLYYAGKETKLTGNIEVFEPKKVIEQKDSKSPSMMLFVQNNKTILALGVLIVVMIILIIFLVIKLLPQKSKTEEPTVSPPVQNASKKGKKQ